MFYYCANKEGYCQGTPVFDVSPDDNPDSYVHNVHCSKSPDNCGQYMTFKQSLKEQLMRTKTQLKDWPQHKCVVALEKELTKKVLPK